VQSKWCSHPRQQSADGGKMDGKGNGLNKKNLFSALKKS
jgi:hypothetical protein